jgi:photosystem II stability/assembly factor-like uncharacterized protein
MDPARGMLIFSVVALTVFSPASVPGAPLASPPGGLPADWVRALHWRPLGPAAMGGRITALAAFEADPTTFWIATASGGLLKTVNNGITFEHQFDREATVSVGAVCVAPSNRDIVWVGTGENNPRNSVSWGDGVYKSSDGGKTWKNMGLRQSFQIGRIAIHPKNADIVYVGALGRLYGASEERGLYKTTDGGKTWAKVLSIDDRTGVIDVAMHPTDPESLLVAAWERRRDGFDTHVGEPLADGYASHDPIVKWGPRGGIYKTTDGGKTFRRLMRGLPSVATGRIGLDYYRKDPNIVFAIVDTEKIGMGPPPNAAFLGVQAAEATGGGVRVTQVADKGPAAKAGLQGGDLLTSADGKELKNYAQLAAIVQGHKPADKLKLTVKRGGDTREVVVDLEPRASPPGNKRERPFSAWFGGQRENVQDQQGPGAVEYGGVYRSSDGGESWTRVNSLNPRPMYFSHVRVDPSDERFVFVLGVLLYRSSDGGKTFRPDGGRDVHPDQHVLWVDPRDGRHLLVGTDGGVYASYDRGDRWDLLNHAAIGQFYHVAVDARRPFRVYGGLQDNGTWGGPSRSSRGPGPVNDDWIVVSGGDGFRCQVDPTDPDLVYFETQDGGVARRNLRTGEVAGFRPKDAPGRPPYRFNWNTPFLLSHHNSHIYYCAGDVVFRSLKQGDDPRPISPELTRTRRGSATALAESPRNPDVLYAGTDDGFLWVTRDGGAKWTNVTDKVGLPGPRWVASLETSRFGEGRLYAAFDGHRSDDDEPHVFVTEDYGQTWKSLRANLPPGSTRVLREDVENPNLLYLGTEFAAWASLDRGASWVKINNNLPTVAIHELAVHPTAGAVVAATHGRSLWAFDATTLRQITPEVLKAPARLFRPATVTRWRPEPPRNAPIGAGSRRFVGENPPGGAQLLYALTRKADKASIEIFDYAGNTVRELPASTEPGLHKVVWDLVRAGVRTPGPRGWRGRLPLLSTAAGPGVLAWQRRPGAPGGNTSAPPGMYRVVLTVDGQEHSQGLRIEADPSAVPAPIVADP